MHERGELVTVLTHEDVELFDLPGAPRPAGETTVPVRFLARWDNLLLSHADLARVLDPTYRPHLASKNGMTPPAFLVDGFAHGTWRVEATATTATLLLDRWMPLPRDAEDALVREGTALLEFLHPNSDDRVVLVSS